MDIVYFYLAAAVFVLALLAVPMVMTFLSMRWFESPSLIRRPTPTPANDSTSRWAQEKGFVFVGDYIFKAGIIDAFISIWKRDGVPQFFCRYNIRAGEANKRSMDFVTVFDGDVMLTTNDRSDSQFLPQAPGCYAQSFSGLSVEEQYQRHVEAENFLKDTGRIALVPSDAAFEDCFLTSLDRQVRHIRSIPLWPIRGAGWFYVRRRLRHNTTLMRQHEKGMIRLPHEIADLRLLEAETV